MGRLFLWGFNFFMRNKNIGDHGIAIGIGEKGNSEIETFLSK